MSQFNYLYKITNLVNRKIYIGVHSTDNLDDDYMGSGKYLKHAKEKYGIENFQKEILEFFDTSEEMFEKEHEIVTEEFVASESTYNLKCGGRGGWDHTKGTITVKDKNGNSFRIYADDPRYLSGELIPNSKGMVTVTDTAGNFFQVPKDDPRYLSGELFCCSCGFFQAKDVNGNIVRVKTNDPRYLSGEFTGTSKNMVTVRDSNGKLFQVPKDDPRYLSGELKHIWNGLKHTEETKRKIGQKNSIHQTGSNNSNYGKCWIYNIELKKSMCVVKEDLLKYLSQGWTKGRKQKF